MYDRKFASKIRRLQEQVKTDLGLLGSEWKGIDHLGTRVWIFEIGGPMTTRHLDLSLLKTPEGLFFLAGLWDADGNWSPPDESHPMGQARIYGSYHIVRYAKHFMKLLWSFKTGRMYVATPEGHISRVGEHIIHTRTNVYGTGVLARSMAAWVLLVGRKMILKKRNVRLGKSLPPVE